MTCGHDLLLRLVTCYRSTCVREQRKHPKRKRQGIYERRHSGSVCVGIAKTYSYGEVADAIHLKVLGNLKVVHLRFISEGVQNKNKNFGTIRKDSEWAVISEQRQEV